MSIAPLVEPRPPTAGGAHSPPAAEPPPPRRRRRRRVGPIVLVVLAMVAGAAAGGVAGWYAGSRAADQGAAPAVSPDETDTSGAETGGDPLRTLPSLVATIEESVVDIQGTMTTSGPFGETATATIAGSGFVYSSDGLIATNAHVVDGVEDLTVGFVDGRELAAEIVGIDTANDLALLRIDADGLTALPLATDLEVAVGDFVIVVGNALALEGGPSVSVGVVSALDRDIEVEDGSTLTGVIQTDAAISSGDSGGPLLTASGAVIGINTAAASSTDTATVQNIGFAIPVTAAAPILAGLAGSTS